MIVLKNGKIIAIEKKILNSLNATLENISNLINNIELEISSIQKTPITINNKIFNVEQIDLFTLEDIKIFQLIPFEEEKIVLEETITPQISLEEVSLEGFEPSIKIEEPELKMKEPAPIEKEKIDMIQPSTTSTIQPEEPVLKPMEKEEEEISISFEDDFSEIETILNLSKEEAREEIEKELKQAANDLSIDLDTIHELKDELFEMFKTEKDSLLKAINQEDYNTIHEIAHKLKGAVLNLRLTNIALILKKIDELSKAKKDLHKIKYLAEKFYLLVDKLYDLEKKETIPKEIKDLILQTIQNYLETQNEKKFKKDKKYIEKLLNVKIESIEDLQKIIKEN